MSLSRAKNLSFETRQLGKHETKEINVEGRLLFDVLIVLEMEHKLSSYSLSAIALEFLGITLAPHTGKIGCSARIL